MLLNGTGCSGFRERSYRISTSESSWLIGVRSRHPRFHLGRGASVHFAGVVAEGSLPAPPLGFRYGAPDATVPRRDEGPADLSAEVSRVAAAEGINLLAEIDAGQAGIGLVDERSGLTHLDFYVLDQGQSGRP